MVLIYSVPIFGLISLFVLFWYMCKYLLENCFKKKYISANNVHNYFQQHKDKAQNERKVSSEVATDNLTPLLSGWLKSTPAQTNCNQCLLDASHNCLCMHI